MQWYMPYFNTWFEDLDDPNIPNITTVCVPKNRVVCENKVIVNKPVQLPKGSKVVVFDKTLGKWVYNNEEK